MHISTLVLIVFMMCFLIWFYFLRFVFLRFVFILLAALVDLMDAERQGTNGVNKK